MKKKNKKERKVLLLLVVLLGVTVGFALLSTTLKINGLAGIKSNKWDIHWENVVPNASSTIEAEDPVIDTNKTKVSYEVTLELPGDYYEFNVDAKNGGSINAEISKIDHAVYESDGVTEATLPEYIKYSIVYEGTDDEPKVGDLLAAGEVQTYTIRIEYDSESKELPATDLTYVVVDEFTYQQTKKEKETDGIAIKSDPSKPTFGCGTIGDEFCIGSECFNMISCDSEKALLFAKYNLKVGYNCTNYTYSWSTTNYCTEIPETAEGYGKQSKNEAGGINFSNEDYWYGKVGTLGTPGIEFDGVVDRQAYYYNEYDEYNWDKAPNVLNQKSPIYQVLNDYDTYLKSIGMAKTGKTRLITIQETYDNFSCIAGVCLYEEEHRTSNRKFIANTSFWTSSAAIGAKDIHDSCIHIINGVSDEYLDTYQDGESIGDNTCTNPTAKTQYIGVRPVIEVPTSSIAYDGWVLTNSLTPLTSQKWQYWENGKKLINGWYKLYDFYGNLQWHYFEDGYAKTGWYEEDGKTYYLSTFDEDGNGYLNCNRLENVTKEIDGTSYTFDADGVCTNCN